MNNITGSLIRRPVSLQPFVDKRKDGADESSTMVLKVSIRRRNPDGSKPRTIRHGKALRVTEASAEMAVPHSAFGIFVVAQIQAA